MTDKIDLLSVGGELSTRQKDIAIGIWKMLGCFDTVSDMAHKLLELHEEKVIERTFYNYNLDNPTEYDKLVRLINQIIDYYRCQFTEGKGVNKIARLTYRKGGQTYTLICTPNKAERLRGWGQRTSSAATNIDRADKMQKDDTKTIPINTIAIVINKVCGRRPLSERPAILKEFITAAQEKLIEVSTTIALLESADNMDKSKDDKLIF